MSLPSGYTWHSAGRPGWGFLCVPDKPGLCCVGSYCLDFDWYTGGRWITSATPGSIRVYCRSENLPDLLYDIERFEHARALQ